VIPFYTRRFFRIAPMFWLGILFFTWLDGMGPRYYAPQGISATDIALTATFLNGWHPLTLTSVVPGGWSIVVEMSFYVIFPLLMLFIRNVRTAIIGFVLSASMSFAIMATLWSQRAVLWPEVSDELVATVLSLWLPSQLPVFMIGFITYFAIRDPGQLHSFRFLKIVLFAAIGMMAALPFILSAITFRGRDPLSCLLYGLCFGVFAFCLARGRGAWLVNPPIRFLGKISFSAYLVHFAVLHTEIGLPQLRASFGSGVGLFAIYLPCLIAVTALISWGTYHLIERPMIGVGSALTRRWAVRDAVVAQ
jgi:peptidoglycan/LPS O-acetylase OafA/YrhL